LATYPNNFAGLWSLTAHKISKFSLENHRLALGVSGGADSIGLFHTFCSLLKQKKIFHLVVFHINFGLRGAESDGDELFLSELCALKNIPFEVFRPKTPILTGIQESARKFRLSVQDIYLQQGYKIALAHNADDVAENVLLRLARGSSVESAAGMHYYDGNIFRPWLGVPRNKIRSHLTEEKIIWREDSSNEKDHYTRNKIRHNIMPILEELFPGASMRITQSFLAESAVGAVTPIDPRTDPVESPETAPSQLLMATFANAATQAISKVVHSFLEDHYGGRSPVSRQVIGQISAAIHKMSTGLDGLPRQFSLPNGRVLHLNMAGMSIQAP
jgi:tRNA(Ile)-lysidine synthetase-like protein